jgi:hypothetical protein
MKISLHFIALLMFVVLATSRSVAADDAPILAEETWASDPQIQDIIKIFTEVQYKKEKNKLRSQRKEFDTCDPREDTERELIVDNKKIPRYYFYAKESNAASIKWEFYYDTAGKLRFSYIEAEAMNGTYIQHRIFFNSEGQRLWENQDLVDGPGYDFPREHWPDATIVMTPLQHFLAKNSCDELK